MQQTSRAIKSKESRRKSLNPCTLVPSICSKRISMKLTLTWQPQQVIIYLDIQCTSKITRVQRLAKLNYLISSTWRYIPTVKFSKQETNFPWVILNFLFLRWICMSSFKSCWCFIIQSGQSGDNGLQFSYIKFKKKL